MGEERAEREGADREAEAAAGVNPQLLAFFDAMDENNYDRMLRALATLARTAGQKELDDIYMVLDMEPQRGEIAEQIAVIRGQIRLLQRFDGGRLR